MRNKISKTKSKRNRSRKIKKKISRRKKIMKNKKSRRQYGGKGACPINAPVTAATAAPGTQSCINYVIMGHGAQIIKPGKYTHIKRIKIPSWFELIWYTPLGHSLIGGIDTEHGPGNALARQICKAGDSPAAYEEYVQFVKEIADRKLIDIQVYHSGDTSQIGQFRRTISDTQELPNSALEWKGYSKYGPTCPDSTIHCCTELACADWSGIWDCNKNKLIKSCTCALGAPIHTVDTLRNYLFEIKKYHRKHYNDKFARIHCIMCRVGAITNVQLYNKRRPSKLHLEEIYDEFPFYDLYMDRSGYTDPRPLRLSDIKRIIDTEIRTPDTGKPQDIGELDEPIFDWKTGISY